MRILSDNEITSISGGLYLEAFAISSTLAMGAALLYYDFTYGAKARRKIYDDFQEVLDTLTPKQKEAIAKQMHLNEVNLYPLTMKWC